MSRKIEVKFAIGDDQSMVGQYIELIEAKSIMKNVEGGELQERETDSNDDEGEES